MSANGIASRAVEPLEPRVFLSTVSFSSTTYAVGTEPKAVAIADFNDDGSPDIAVVNGQAGTVSVLLNNGNGTFQSQLIEGTGPNPTSLAVSDLNSDGKSDLVVANYGAASTVSVLLGNGNGSFQTQAGRASGSYTSAVVTGDFNGDGNQDIIAADLAPQSATGIIEYFAGNGNGTFQAAQTFSSVADPSQMAVADLNGDGRPDLIVVSGEDSYCIVYLGNGNGTFQTGQTFATPEGPDAVAVGDFNGDGIPDLALTNFDAISVSVLLGNGNGTFQPEQTSLVGYGPDAVAVADLNGDGKSDLIVANMNSYSVSVLLGNGNGTFQTQQTFAVGQPTAVAVADLNGDGKPDIVATNFTEGTATVLLNTYSASPTIHQSGGMVTGTATSFNDNASVSVSGSNVIITIDGTGDTIPISSITGILIDPGAGNDSINIDAGVPPVTVGGAGGDDTISASNENDSLRGGGGTDVITAGDGSNTTVVGGAGDDTLSGTGFGQGLFGGPGDDLFINADGSGDSVNGGAGLNFAQENSGDTLTNIFETYDPNPLEDSPALSTDTVADSSGGNDLQIFGTSGNDSITLSDDGNGNILINGANPVPAAGLTGILLAGGLGDDTLTVDSSVLLPVTLRGAKGNDSLTGGGGDNVIVGGAGNDTLVGGDGTNDLAPGRRVTFEDSPSGNDVLIGGPTGSQNFADFAYRTDNLFLSNDGEPDSGDTAMGEATTIMPSVQNFFAGTGQDTVISTIAGSFISAGIGQDSLTSGGANTSLVAGPPGAGGDTVIANGLTNALFLQNGQADDYANTVPSDIIEIDAGIDSLLSS